MKVGIFAGDALPEQGGGFTFEEEVLSSLMSVAPESRHEFVIYGTTPCREQHAREKVTQFPLKRSFLRRSGEKFARITVAIGRKLSHVHEPLYVRGFLDKWVRDHGIHFMWHLTPGGTRSHDAPYAVPVWDLQHRLQPWFPEVSVGSQWDGRERYWARTLRRATVVVAGTEAGKQEIMQFYQVPAERIRILPHPTPRFAIETGRSPDAHSPDGILQKYHIPPGFLFYPAQFWPHKNHVGLLRSVRHLRDQHNLVLPVVFVGADKGNGQCVQQVVQHLNLSGQVHSLGFVPRDDLVALYRRAFALVYLTYFGPENMPPLEAFALGCPVIASDVPGAREQLGEAALLVDPRRPQDVAVAIKRLHDGPALRKQLIRRGTLRATRFTGPDFAKGILTILDELESVLTVWDRRLYSPTY